LVNADEKTVFFIRLLLLNKLKGLVTEINSLAYGSLESASVTVGRIVE
jgi:hypothetical protein